MSDLTEDQKWMSEHFFFEWSGEDDNPIEQGGAPWVLRLEFDSNCMDSVGVHHPQCLRRIATAMRHRQVTTLQQDAFGLVYMKQWCSFSSEVWLLSF